MTLKKITAGCALLLAAATLPGCLHQMIDPPGGARTTGGGAAVDAGSDELRDSKGAQPLPGEVEIAAVDREAADSEGVVRYTVDNVSGERIESLSWSVTFYYPAPQAANGGIQLKKIGVFSAERDLELFAKDKGIVLEAKNPEFETRRGEKMLGTKLSIVKNLPTLTVPRVGEDPGTRFLQATLECTGMAPEDTWRGVASPDFWIDVQNVSSTEVSFADVQVSFLNFDKNVVSNSGWQQMPNVKPGETKRVKVDVSKVERITGSVWVRMKLAEF